MKDDLVYKKDVAKALKTKASHLFFDKHNNFTPNGLLLLEIVSDVPPVLDLSEYSDKLWQNAFETGKKFAAVQSDGCQTPCDLCKYDPPSSGDGKPCSMCPAAAK